MPFNASEDQSPCQRPLAEHACDVDGQPPVFGTYRADGDATARHLTCPNGHEWTEQSHRS